MKVNIIIEVLNECNEKVCKGDMLKVKTPKNTYIGRVFDIESKGLKLDCDNGVKALKYDSILTIETIK